MSDAKWTKGPWSCICLSDESWSPCIFAGTKLVGMVGNTEDTQDQSRANAHLIAAAPDMADLASLVMDYCGDPKGISDSRRDELYDLALWTMKKARGES